MEGVSGTSPIDRQGANDFRQSEFTHTPLYAENESNIGTIDTFEDVSYNGWPSRGGRLTLSKMGLIFYAPPGTPPDKSKLKVRWTSVIKVKISPQSHPKLLLKLETKYNNQGIFEFSNRAELEACRVKIHLRLEASLKEAAGGQNEKKNTKVSSSPSPSTSPEKTRYTNVGFRGHKGGRLVLDESKLAFISPDGEDNSYWEWTSIQVFKGNPPNQATALLRIKDKENVSFTFQLKNRMDLERIKVDIRQRLSRIFGDSIDSPTQVPEAPTGTAGGNKMYSVLKKSHGGSRKQHDSVTKTFGSFPRHIGPAADIRELEYISALHQNAELLLRSDGTISSQDIIPYLTSRYGLQITSEQAIDIACNLCGGKLRNKFSAKLDAHNEELANPYEHREVPTSEDEVEDEEEEPVYYFDLVQVMSLLVIPELSQLADQYQASRLSRTPPIWSDLSKPVTFKANEKKHVDKREKEAEQEEAPPKPKIANAQLSDKAVGVVKVVLEQLSEIFDEELQREIRNGAPIDTDIMITILESFGDVDTANDPVKVQQMLDALRINGGPPVLTMESFVAAITSDIATYPTKSPGEDVSDSRTSLFFDVFGYNWDEDTDAKGSTQNKLEVLATASFIDYAADTYRSVFHNTSVWCLFILTTLVYLSFFLALLKEEVGEVFCPDAEHFFCAAGNKIVAWILTAIFCGLYGLLFILPTSVGNVYGKKGLLFFTIVITAVLAFVPFSTLLWYRQGIPHTIVVTTAYRDICPGWLGDDEDVEADAEADAEEVWDELDANGTLSFDETKSYLILDTECSPIVEWCRSHPEVLGKYLDEDPDSLSYEEFEMCYQWTLSEFLDDLLVQSGEPCNPIRVASGIDECPGFGDCARSNLTESSEFICCHDSAVAYSNDEGGFGLVCNSQPVGAPCKDNRMCESFECAVNDTATCIVPPPDGSGAASSNSKLIGDRCDRNHDECTSGFCFNGKCAEHPQWCPLPYLEVFGGVKLDPYCRTVEEWCDINDWEALALSLFGDQVGDDFVGDAADATEEVVEDVSNILGGQGEELAEKAREEIVKACTAVLDEYLELNVWLSEEADGFSFVKRIPEAEAKLVTAAEYEVTNHIENTLDDPWAYFILLGIGIVGVVTFFAVLKGLVRPVSGNVRVRDYKIKCAASHKIADVIENALGMHMVQGASTKGQVMRNFFLHGENIVEAGGLPWTVRQLVSGRMFSEEGIRFTGRLWIGQVVQVIVTIVGIAYASDLVDYFVKYLDEIRDELGYTFTRDELLAIPPRNWTTVTRDDLTVTEEEQKILDTLPEGWVIEVAGIPAIIVGSLVACFCICVYVPSYTNTIIKLRSGMLPSLFDPYFFSYRNSGDKVIQNIGNMVFSLMGAAVFTAFLTFAFIFVFAYPITREYAVGYLSTAIGIASTMVIKIIGQKLLRGRNFSSFYRKLPQSANYWSLFFECWYLGTGLLVVVSRLIMFVVSGALWLGRIDVEFLHPNVKIFGKGLDAVPNGFTRDLLAHEAHTHPYIERLGSMYLMRLRDGERFGSVTGTSWRCLFVKGLMPWIVKYNVNSLDQEYFDDDE